VKFEHLVMGCTPVCELFCWVSTC